MIGDEWLTIALIVVLLALSALASGSETATTAASRIVVRQAVQAGDRRARILERLLEDRERLVATLLIANNLVNIFGTAVATDALVRVTGEAGVYLATAIMTVVLVVFGEVMPKTYAMRHAERLALALAPVLRGLVVLFTPATLLLHALFAMAPRAAARGRAAAASRAAFLRAAIALWTERGVLNEPEREMLSGVLDLLELEVRHVVTHRSRMATLPADATPRSVLPLLKEKPFSRFPVHAGTAEEIVGIVHIRDILQCIDDTGRLREDVTLRAIMKPAWFVPATTPLATQLLAFRHRQLHMALVVDEYGSLLGLVTLEDIVEEVVGDIVDEKDVELAEIQREDGGSALVEGSVPVRDLNRHMEWDLPEGEAATLAGLVMEVAGRIPEAGETLKIDGYEVEVVRRQRHRLALLRVRRGPVERLDDGRS
ncbi:Magnesium and cobalt efflux protein CorC [bacterium HR40]|nr:Magnesium and cobalt efflux protein CorC [bacterium HR40]